MLLYPHHIGLGPGALAAVCDIMAGDERLRIASVDLVTGEGAVVQRLARLMAPVEASEMAVARYVIRLGLRKAD